MAQILGLGVTHFPPLMFPDERMAMYLERILASDKVPQAAKDPKGWPQLMRDEWGTDRGRSAARHHRKRLVDGMGRLRRDLDAFKPDVVVIWGDDQYENFREDCMPPFCVYALGHVDCRPFAKTVSGKSDNVWQEPADKVFRYRGHRQAGKYATGALIDAGFDMAYTYVARYELGLARAFTNTILYLDYERKGWDYPIVPFHVNCYGSAVIRNQGQTAHLDPGEVPEADPPGPSPERCFDLGARLARAFAESPWRVALIASSSWSHAFLTEKTSWLMPDRESDYERFEDLKANRFSRWRNLKTAELESAGEHEFLNWVCLAGAMSELGYKAEVVDYIESYVFNSNKCLALFRP